MNAWRHLVQVVVLVAATCTGVPAAERGTVVCEHYLPRAAQHGAEPAEPLTRFRGRCRMLLLVAEDGTEVLLRVTDSQVSRRYTRPMRLWVESDDGNRLLSGTLEPGQSGKFRFQAERGLYTLHVDAQSNAVQVRSSGARLCIPASPTERCPVIHGSQRLWFYVPEASDGFQVDLRGQGTGETAAAVVYTPDGKEAARGSTAGSDRALIDVSVPPGHRNAVWSLQIVRAESGTLEDATFALVGGVAPVVAQTPGDLAVPAMRVDLPGVCRRGDGEAVAIRGNVLVPGSDGKQPAIRLTAKQEEREVFASNIPVESGRFEAVLPREKLSAGAYDIEIALAEGGRTVATQRRSVFIVDRPGNLRADKVTLHGGKPFFARGLYHVKPEDYPLLVRHGFNIVQAHPDSVPACQKAGINAAVALYFGMRVNPEYYREKIAQYGDNPAAVCWMIMDEPAANNMPLERIQEGYGTIRTADAKRPAYMCICRPDAYTTYGRATDIIAIDVYPIREGADDIGRIAETLQIAARDVPDQTVWFVGQVWSWPGRDDPSKRRPVTAAEHRAMTYLALTFGNVRGLMWYSFRDPDWYLPESNPEVWAACKKVNDELIALEPVLLEANLAEGWIEGSGGVKIRVGQKRHGNAIYAIAVNPTRKPTKANVTPAAKTQGAKAEVLFEDRTLDVAGGKITDDFAPLGVHVYRIPLR